LGVIKKQGVINTVLVYTGTLIGFVSLLFIQPVFLSKEELGLTRMILGFAAIMSILFSFGISAVTIRYLPKTFGHDHRHRGFFGFVLVYTTLSVIAGCVILFAAKSWIFSFYETGSQQFIEHFHFVVLLTIINAYILGLNSYCIALLKTTFTTFLNDVLSKILFIAIIFLHFFGYLDLEQFLFAFCMTYGITCILLIVNIFFIDRPGFIPDSKYIRENIGYRPIIRYGIIITVTAMNSVGLKYLDTLFVGTISVGDAGIYSIAAFIGLMIEMPLNALERIANPAIAHAMASKNMAEIKSIYYLSARFLLVLGGWLFVMVISNVNDLLLVLPEEYQGGVLVTIFISCGALINMATGINYPILINSDKYIWGSAFNIFLIVMTVIGNILLIPEMGMLGAAVTAFAASSIYNLLKFIFIKNRFQLQPFDSKTAYIFLLILALSAAGYFIQPGINPFIAIAGKGILLSLIYFSIIIASRWVTDLYKYVPASIKKRFNFFNER
jgi:O-antigen/teichoic acid export membrane protein